MCNRHGKFQKPDGKIPQLAWKIPHSNSNLPAWKISQLAWKIQFSKKNPAYTFFS
jgi:hypothetical protein